MNDIIREVCQIKVDSNSSEIDFLMSATRLKARNLAQKLGWGKYSEYEQYDGIPNWVDRPAKGMPGCYNMQEAIDEALYFGATYANFTIILIKELNEQRN